MGRVRRVEALREHKGVRYLCFFTNTISGAREISSIAVGANVLDMPTSLVPSVSYTPWGAIAGLTDGCTGSSCTQIQEAYSYNNRLQPVTIQVGTSANPTANYCLVYNYYGTAANPSSCTTTPTVGTDDNGTVMGVWYQDNANSSYGYSATYHYDGVNRLSTAVATATARTTWLTAIRGTARRASTAT